MQEQQKSNFLGDAIIIAVGTLFGYLITVFYGRGYNSYFHIPSEFISIDMNHIVLALVAVCGIYLAIFPILEMIISTGVFDNHNMLARTVAIQIILWICFGFYLLLTQPKETELIFPLGLLGIITMVDFIFPLIFERNRKGYVNKFNAQAQRDAEVSKKGLIFKISNKTGRSFLLLLIILLISLPFAYAKGSSDARHKIYFEILNTTPQTAVLQIYNNFLVVSTYNSSTGKLGEGIKFVSLDSISDKNLILYPASVGPLKP